MIGIREISSIPDNLLTLNENFAKYNSSKFKCMHYITEIENKEIKVQYLIGRIHNEEDVNACFSGLETSLGLGLKQTETFSIKKKKS